MRMEDRCGIVTAAGFGMGRAGFVRFTWEGAAVAVVDAALFLLSDVAPERNCLRPCDTCDERDVKHLPAGDPRILHREFASCPTCPFPQFLDMFPMIDIMR